MKNDEFFIELSIKNIKNVSPVTVRPVTLMWLIDGNRRDRLAINKKYINHIIFSAC